MRKFALLVAMALGWCRSNPLPVLARAGGRGFVLFVLMANHGAATEMPVDLDAYCTKTYGAGAVAGFDRRDNSPLCSERTNQGLGLLHHKVDPSAVCRTQQKTARYRKEGRQIFCLANDESPHFDRKVDLAEYCESNYGPSAIVSRRPTDNQPLCTVKGDGGLSQTHYAIDLGELCGRPVPSAAVEGDILDCSAASRQAGRDRGDPDGGPQAGAAPRPSNGRPPNVPRDAPSDVPILSLADIADLDLSDCGFRDVEHAEKSPDGRGGFGWKYGGIDTPCSELGTGLKVDLDAYCRRLHPPDGMRWRDGGRPVCYEDPGGLAFFDLLFACMDAFPGGYKALYASATGGLIRAIVKFSNGSLECFYVDVAGGRPSEPDELVEAET